MSAGLRKVTGRRSHEAVSDPVLGQPGLIFFIPKGLVFFCLPSVTMAALKDLPP